MRQVQLGQSGPKVGAVGLGAMSFGGIYGTTNEAESHATLAKALDLGVNHIDTANIYGMGVSESAIGSFLRNNPGTREQFVIATKASIITEPERDFRNDEPYLRAELEASLKRLGTNHVELFYIHRRDPRVPVEDMMGTLTRFIEEGKIGAIGLSEIQPATLERAASVHSVAAVQSEYSLQTRLPEMGMLQMCRKLGTTFVSFSPVGRGLLTDKDPDRRQFPDVDFRKSNPRFTEPNLSANMEKVQELRAFARQKGVATSTLAIAWTFAMAPNSVSIPGTRSAGHLTENTAGADLPLSSDDLAKIEGLIPVGWCHGARYSHAQAFGVEDYC
ncbi:MAG: aldo/keto reductase [Pseudomonadota bacterium]